MKQHFWRAFTLAAIVAAAFAVWLAPALATGGDYGVNTGASTASDCDGNECNITINGYALTYSHTESDGDLVYTFDDFDCTLWLHTNGDSSGRGAGCSQYQP